MHRQRAIDGGDDRMEWEPAPGHWDLTVKHYWQACHIKVVEIAVATCRIPLSRTKFPFDEGEHNIIGFMEGTWPSTGTRQQPTYVAIDKGCSVM
jgi:hypothetical protein